MEDKPRPAREYEIGRKAVSVSSGGGTGREAGGTVQSRASRASLAPSSIVFLICTTSEPTRFLSEVSLYSELLGPLPEEDTSKSSARQNQPPAFCPHYFPPHYLVANPAQVESTSILRSRYVFTEGRKLPSSNYRCLLKHLESQRKRQTVVKREGRISHCRATIFFLLFARIKPHICQQQCHDSLVYQRPASTTCQ